MITEDARWIWVSMPWATFAIAVKDGRVADGPPITRGRRMRLIGMDERDAAEYLKARGAVFRPLPQA